jgi:bifunctional UDP-N-acetylglucosamine pyrophosphorylase/glucosamine-1-phosphate N-acetyltransferase
MKVKYVKVTSCSSFLYTDVTFLRIDMKLQAIVLAAGKGTRMKSSVPKPLIVVNGEPMLTTVLRTLSESDVAESPVLVVGAWTTAIQDHYGERYQYAVQIELNGTGGAVEAAISNIDTSDDAAPVLILYADTPFITVESLQKLHAHVEVTKSAFTMYTVTLPDFNDWRGSFMAFGRIIRNDAGQVASIIEHKVATEAERTIREVNPAVYCVQASWLKAALPKILTNELSGERYLTDLVALAQSDGLIIDTITLPAKESFGLNSRTDIEHVMKL